MTEEIYELNPQLKLYTDREACEYLHTAPVTLWRERKHKRISFRRLGGKIFYASEDLAEFLERNKQSAK